ncbi:Stonustoxin subunit alpha [Anabarilius grahami]|uniref:Stonustoxin subunit alpha n=1 Tax=Anabarilius grahami TaxID=495550 RepID=A0A3N0Y514_ANAGA|nr:Stonustoxin subunit alpha [Anabarilius grahami]
MRRVRRSTIKGVYLQSRNTRTTYTLSKQENRRVHGACPPPQIKQRGSGVGALETYRQVRGVQTGVEVSRAGLGPRAVMAGLEQRTAVTEQRTAVTGQVPWAAMAGQESQVAEMGQGPWAAMAGLEPRATMEGQRPWAAMVGQELRTAMAGQEPWAAKAGLELRMVMVGQELRTAMAGKRPWTAMAGKRPWTAMAGKRPWTAMADSRLLTLDVNSVNNRLHLSDGNTVLTETDTNQCYTDHPDRFDCWVQALCSESVTGRCYWEVEWSGSDAISEVDISVTYKSIRRKEDGLESVAGCNNQSWSLFCTPDGYSFWHNNIETKLPVVNVSSTMGVYVDHSAGILSFYSVSDTMSLIHRVQTTFTQPLYAMLGLQKHTTVKLCRLTN